MKQAGVTEAVLAILSKCMYYVSRLMRCLVEGPNIKFEWIWAGHSVEESRMRC